MPTKTVTRIRQTLQSVLSPESINELGLQAGQSERLRVVTPFRLVLALLGGFATGKLRTVADLQREFNYQTRAHTRYKAFYNRLAHRGFAVFMRALVLRLMRVLVLRTLNAKEMSPLCRFRDILIQDGTSFAVNKRVPREFCGGLSENTPLARLHTTFSGLDDAVRYVRLTGNSTGELRGAPDPERLTGTLFLADRAYGSLPNMRRLDAYAASFLIRLSRSHNPWVYAVYRKHQAQVLPRPIRLSVLMVHAQNHALDLDVAYGDRRSPVIFRLLILPGHEPAGTRLCTNLARKDFSPALLGSLYRFRWQVELLFREWKSFANLKSFNTRNPDLLEGLIWASLATAIITRFIAHAAQSHLRCELSTQRVAMSAQYFFPDLLRAISRHPPVLGRVLAQIFAFLRTNAPRANPARDRRSGRLACGLSPQIKGIGSP